MHFILTECAKATYFCIPDITFTKLKRLIGLITALWAVWEFLRICKFPNTSYKIIQQRRDNNDAGDSKEQKYENNGEIDGEMSSI